MAFSSTHFTHGTHMYAYITLHMQLFRADLISAMKLPDSMPLDPGSFLTIKEPWRTEWEVGVQVSARFFFKVKVGIKRVLKPLIYIH